MCGIAGGIAITRQGEKHLSLIRDAMSCLKKRGPDAEGFFSHEKVVLAHTRLSVIDTTNAANQPMTDASGRFTIIFNGEFFNFNEHRNYLIDKGINLVSHSDTEVLLNLYILEGEKCLQKVNGFFSLAIYDKAEHTLFIARDRVGIKPLLIYQDEHSFLFASEMKALLAMNIPKEIDQTSLYTYFQLNYIPEPYSILKNVTKLKPGSFLKIKLSESKIDIQTEIYYNIPATNNSSEKNQSLSYTEAQKTLYQLLDSSVERRLVSDVPLGSFLSGGIDSSIITALASQHTSHLKTFSIGFRNESYFDETHYANLVAEKYKTDHTVFSLTTTDLLNDLFPALDYLDEPFADSSSLAVHILSRETRKHVTVALSGDGGDELFAGYNKHKAELSARQKSLRNLILKLTPPIWKIVPQSRNSKIGNLSRQINRFTEGLRLNDKQRYWRWASLMDQQDAYSLLQNIPAELREFQERQSKLLHRIGDSQTLNDVLLTDMNLVLTGDMLRKVDSMSMANSLEVRNPLLDYTMVNFAFSLPPSFKINSHGQKQILKDTFKNILPDELLKRKKQGFEVPLYKWFNNELKPIVEGELLSDNFIHEQGLFSINEIKKIKSKLFSNNPGDSPAHVWALIAFQHWWKKYFVA